MRRKFTLRLVRTASVEARVRRGLVRRCSRSAAVSASTRLMSLVYHTPLREAAPALHPTFWLVYGYLLRAGKAASLFLKFGALWNSFYNKSADVDDLNSGTVPTVHQPLDLLPSAFEGIECAYRVKYCRLNRKIRKIVKNKYRYQKRYEWIPPRARLPFVVGLFKKAIAIDDALVSVGRFYNVVSPLLTDRDDSLVVTMARQHQLVTVNLLSQTAKR